MQGQKLVRDDPLYSMEGAWRGVGGGDFHCWSLSFSPVSFSLSCVWINTQGRRGKTTLIRSKNNNNECTTHTKILKSPVVFKNHGFVAGHSSVSPVYHQIQGRHISIPALLHTTKSLGCNEKRCSIGSVTDITNVTRSKKKS